MESCRVGVGGDKVLREVLGYFGLQMSEVMGEERSEAWGSCSFER